MSVENPDFILYAQHGWADNNRALATAAKYPDASRSKMAAPSVFGGIQWE
jgi:hypothetical protein